MVDAFGRTIFAGAECFEDMACKCANDMGCCVAGCGVFFFFLLFFFSFSDEYKSVGRRSDGILGICVP